MTPRTLILQEATIKVANDPKSPLAMKPSPGMWNVRTANITVRKIVRSNKKALKRGGLTSGETSAAITVSI